MQLDYTYFNIESEAMMSTKTTIGSLRSMIKETNHLWKEITLTYIALHAPGTWYLRCNLDNQYLAWAFELSASRANSKFSFAF